MEERWIGLPRGIEVLTAWLEADHDEGALFGSRFLETVREGPQAEAELAVGLAKLAALLLIEASSASGRTCVEILQKISTTYGT